MIQPYLREVEGWLVGSQEEKAKRLRELEAHLHEAEAAGDLEGALERFGSPREAAATFSQLEEARPAPPLARALAALVDYLPLVAATVAVGLFDAFDGTSGISLSVPAALVVDGRWELWQNLVTPIALLWSVLGVAILEARNGRTPGKALTGVRTVSDDGTAITLRQAVLRRVPLLFGPFVWLDVVAAAFIDRRRRVFDLVAHTVVVAAPAGATAARQPVGRRSSRPS